jgi:hypothetical protein
MKRYGQAVTWSQRQLHLGFDWMFGDQTQRRALRNRGKHELRLHQGKGIPNALTWPTPEGNIGKAWTADRAFRGETFRVETLRLFPKCGMTMDVVRGQEDQAVGRNRIASEYPLQMLEYRAQSRPHCQVAKDSPGYTWTSEPTRCATS